MSTLPHNDDHFAKFMVNLAKKIIDRQDEREAENARIFAEYDARANDIKQQVLFDLLNSPAPSSVQRKAATSIFNRQVVVSSTANRVSASSHSHAIHQEDDDTTAGFFITKEEIEVIRAYFNGEDVISTIMSQDR